MISKKHSIHIGWYTGLEGASRGVLGSYGPEKELSRGTYAAKNSSLAWYWGGSRAGENLVVQQPTAQSWSLYSFAHAQVL